MYPRRGERLLAYSVKFLHGLDAVPPVVEDGPAPHGEPHPVGAELARHQNAAARLLAHGDLGHLDAVPSIQVPHRVLEGPVPDPAQDGRPPDLVGRVASDDARDPDPDGPPPVADPVHRPRPPGRSAEGPPHPLRLEELVEADVPRQPVRARQVDVAGIPGGGVGSGGGFMERHHDVRSRGSIGGGGIGGGAAILRGGRSPPPPPGGPRPQCPAGWVPVPPAAAAHLRQVQRQVDQRPDEVQPLGEVRQAPGQVGHRGLLGQRIEDRSQQGAADQVEGGLPCLGGATVGSVGDHI